MNIRRPVIHTHEEAFAKQIESMPGVLNVHRNVRVHRNFNGRQRREVDLVVVMSKVVLVAELKHLYGTVTFEEETGFYVQDAKDSVRFDPNEIDEIASDLRHMYVDATGEACPAIIGVNFMTHPESSIADEQNAGGSVVFPYMHKDLLFSVLHEFNSGFDSSTTTEEIDLFIGNLPTWDIVKTDSCIKFGDVEDGLVSSLRSEYDVIKTVDVRRWWLRWLFKTPKYKLFGLKRHAYEWTEISHEQHLKLLQPGRMQSNYAGTAWTLWFGSDRQFRQQFVGTVRSGLASLINRSDAASRYGVLINAVGNTTHGVVSYINHSLALVQIAPDVVGGVYGHQVDDLVVGDIIEVGIESVESPKEIQLQIVEEMKKK